jgi:hypothetical protein
MDDKVPERRGRENAPVSLGGPEYRHIGLPVAVVVGGDRDISLLSPRDRVKARGRLASEPLTGRRTKDGAVGGSISVKVRRDGDVARLAPRLNKEALAGSLYIPSAVRRPEHSRIALVVAIEIAGDRLVAVYSERRDGTR